MPMLVPRAQAKDSPLVGRGLRPSHRRHDDKLNLEPVPREREKTVEQHPDGVQWRDAQLHLDDRSTCEDLGGRK